ncbi:cation:proton antiporter [Marinisporobacter balticus]|uniref:Kef-type K+ transport system membrane component KefB n=1 Tax=Marinisporobacter balticus TaxID=2018667 RepID=A0A4R2KZW5_9FIRM|nr:cation:proton antiporter [Marinisporobacter balticus]TCO78782.1 Kef-type K+ transport system membrane component KefB [Marinisporobacter balticus]
MDSKAVFLMHIGILLLGANIGGFISTKLKQPAVLGQILVGIFLGMGILEKTELIHYLSEIGVVLLMFIAGLETDVNELRASGKSSAAIAVAGVIVPIVMVSGAAYLISGNFISSIILGLISVATSVSISVQTLKELGHLRTRQGVGILGAAIIDDIIGIVLLTIVVGMARPGTGGNVFIVILKIFLFFVITMVVGYILVRILVKISDRVNVRRRIVPYAIISCLILAFISEELGVAAVTGAYFAGVIFSMTPYRHKVSHDVGVIADTIFTPIFFVGIGLGVELSSIGDGLGFSILLLGLGIIGKIAGCGFGAKITGFSGKHALQVGIGMVPRAEVSIIIANLGLKMALIGHKEFASAIVLVIATTLITPLLLKWSFKGERKSIKDTIE